VIVNGSLFRDILVSEGLPAELVIEGPAIRYEYLLDHKLLSERARTGRVLVTLPLPSEEAVELILKVVEAFSEHDTFRIVIKPHPMMPLRRVLRSAGIDRLPAGFESVSGSMADVLPGSDVVVALSSSTLFETWC